MTSVQFVDIPWNQQNVRIEYQWVGERSTDAPLILFLHEGLGSLGMWRDFPEQLCQALNCQGLVYSRPGYGQSTPRHTDESWAPDFMHRQAFEVLPVLLSALSIDPEKRKLWLFGHSDGGTIALLYASRFSDQLAGIIILAPHILVEDMTIESIEQARIAYRDTDLRQRLARYHADPDSAFRGWNDIWLAPAFRDWCIRDELATIQCPVLAVQGKDDIYGSMEQIHGIQRKVPQTQLKELEECGHSPHRDQPQQLIQLVEEFLQQQTPS